MKKYAIIKLGGKQLKVFENTSFDIERQDELNMDVLAYFDGESLSLGTPVLSDVTVVAETTSTQMGDKIIVGRFKSKSRYKKKRGHKQPMSTIKVNSISKGAADKVKKEVKVKERSSKE